MEAAFISKALPNPHIVPHRKPEIQCWRPHYEQPSPRRLSRARSASLVECVLATPRFQDLGGSASRTRLHEQIPGITEQDVRRVCARFSSNSSFTELHAAQLGGIFVNRTKIIRFQFRVVVQNLLFCHPASKPIQHIPYSDAQTADARLAGAFARFDRDAGRHASRISLACPLRSHDRAILQQGTPAMIIHRHQQLTKSSYWRSGP